MRVWARFDNHRAFGACWARNPKLRDWTAQGISRTLKRQPSTDFQPRLTNFQPADTRLPVRAAKTSTRQQSAKLPEEGQYHFTALRGVQAGREYYVTMCPLRLLPRMFLFDDFEFAPEFRAQRTLNRARIPEMARYVVSNPTGYVFSSITASLDGDVRFEPFDDGSRNKIAGRLVVPMTARFVVNDGQHRRAAIEEALRARPELGEETISVVFFLDTGLRHSQQMFADLNRHAVRPTKSLGILYDHRDEMSQLATKLANEVEPFKGLTELEKTSISNRSRKLFTLSAIYLATQSLLRKNKTQEISSQEAALASEFWREVSKHMPDWQDALARKISPSELRRDYVHAHAIALQAIAVAGAALLASEPKKWKASLKNLKTIDWSRSNTGLWEGRVLLAGRVSKSQASVHLATNVIKQHLGLSLTAQDKRFEVQKNGEANQVKSRRPSAQHSEAQGR